jgi:hypothetical protein
MLSPVALIHHVGISTIANGSQFTLQVIEMSGVSAASDIWSVGCTVIELLTCVPPYFDLQPMPALFRIVQVFLKIWLLLPVLVGASEKRFECIFVVFRNGK